MTLYGIPNCDTVKKARAWFAAHAIDMPFHDLVNRRGTSWRRLSAEQQAACDDPTALTELLLAQPTLIRRPVVEIGDHITVGFVPDTWQTQLGDGR
jgi:arsenate reductase-like glutaredoxin family protein